MAGTTAKRALTALAVEPGSALETSINGKAASSHTHVLASITDAGTAASKTAGNSVGNVPMVESGGTLNSALIPSIPATHVFVVASQAAMLALSTAVVGDIAKRTDLGTSFVLQTAPPSTLANWITLTDASSVTSVNGLSGSVTLTTSNITEGTNLYYTTARVNTDAPNVTLAASADVLLGVTGQALSLDTQSAKFVLMGPTSGGAAAPTFRLLVAGDLPTHTHVLADITDAQAALDLKADLTTSGLTNYTTTTVQTALLAGKANLAAGNSFTGQQIYTVTATGAPESIRVSAGANVGVVFEVKDRLGAVVVSIDDTGQISGGLISGVFSGSGASLTALPAGNLATGTVPTARLGSGTASSTTFLHGNSTWAALVAGDIPNIAQSQVTNLTTDLAAKAPLARLAQLNVGTVTTSTTPDASAAAVFNITLGAATVTINAPTNPTDGQTIKFKLRQDATGNRAVTWNAIYSFGSDITAAPSLSTAANKVDVIGFIYDATAVKWWLSAYARGY